MCCVRALPIFQLMPAVGSRKVPVATPLLGGLPGKIERPHPSPPVGHPIHHHVAGPSSVHPDKAGRRHSATLSRTTFSHGRAADDLNHNLFRLVLANRVCGGSSSASRSFVLAALRALHLDPDCRSTATRHMAGTRPNNEND